VYFSDSKRVRKNRVVINFTPLAICFISSYSNNPDCCWDMYYYTFIVLLFEVGTLQALLSVHVNPIIDFTSSRMIEHDLILGDVHGEVLRLQRTCSAAAKIALAPTQGTSNKNPPTTQTYGCNENNFTMVASGKMYFFPNTVLAGEILRGVKDVNAVDGRTKSVTTISLSSGLRIRSQIFMDAKEYKTDSATDKKHDRITNPFFTPHNYPLARAAYSAFYFCRSLSKYNSQGTVVDKVSYDYLRSLVADIKVNEVTLTSTSSLKSASVVSSDSELVFLDQLNEILQERNNHTRYHRSTDLPCETSGFAFGSTALDIKCDNMDWMLTPMNKALNDAMKKNRDKTNDAIKANQVTTIANIKKVESNINKYVTSNFLSLTTKINEVVSFVQVLDSLVTEMRLNTIRSQANRWELFFFELSVSRDKFRKLETLVNSNTGLIPLINLPTDFQSLVNQQLSKHYHTSPRCMFTQGTNFTISCTTLLSDKLINEIVIRPFIPGYYCSERRFILKSNRCWERLDFDNSIPTFQTSTCNIPQSEGIFDQDFTTHDCENRGDYIERYNDLCFRVTSSEVSNDCNMGTLSLNFETTVIKYKKPFEKLYLPLRLPKFQTKKSIDLLNSTKFDAYKGVELEDKISLVSGTIYGMDTPSQRSAVGSLIGLIVVTTIISIAVCINCIFLYGRCCSRTSVATMLRKRNAGFCPVETAS